MNFIQRFVLRVLLCVVAFIAPVAANSQTVTYSLGAESELLDAAFYTGQAGDGSNVAGRGVLNIGVNNAGTKALLWGINLDTEQQGLFMVDVGEPSSWRRVSPDRAFAFDRIVWCPDDVHAFVGFNKIFDTSTNTLDDNARVGGVSFYFTHVRRADGFAWATAARSAGNGEVTIFSINADGTWDPNHQVGVLTDFPVAPTELIFFGAMSPDLDSIVFTIEDFSGNPEVSNVYLLSGVADIIAGNQPEPVLLSDPRITEVRASSTPNYVSASAFSADGSLVFMSEDYLNAMDSTDLLGSLANADFDINIAAPDGSGFARFAEPGGQGGVLPFASGGRIHYINEAWHVVVSTLAAQSDITAETTALPEGGTTAVIGGNNVGLPFTLTDSAVQATTDVTVSDASGTTIELPTDQVINFPDGTATPEISIFTPIDPVTYNELPDPATQIPVIRTFGPAGTQFYPPISITISYSNAEVQGIFDETQMIPYLYNTTTQEFEALDEPFLSTVVVDPDANTLTFETDHFSTYGIGFSATVAPQRPWAVYGLVVVMAMAGIGLLRLRSRETETI